MNLNISANESYLFIQFLNQISWILGYLWRRDWNEQKVSQRGCFCMDSCSQRGRARTEVARDHNPWATRHCKGWHFFDLQIFLPEVELRNHEARNPVVGFQVSFYSNTSSRYFMGNRVEMTMDGRSLDFWFPNNYCKSWCPLVIPWQQLSQLRF